MEKLSIYSRKSDSGGNNATSIYISCAISLFSTKPADQAGCIFPHCARCLAGKASTSTIKNTSNAADKEVSYLYIRENTYVPMLPESNHLGFS